MIDKKLGRVSRATFGMGGYQDAMIGLSLSFEGDGWGTSTFYGTWPFPPDKNANWTREEQQKVIADTVWRLGDTLSKSKRQHVADLVGVPVEVTFDGLTLSDWRVLTEVIGK